MLYQYTNTMCKSYTLYNVLMLLSFSPVLTLLQPHDCSLPGSSVSEISLGKNTVVGCCIPSPGDLPNSRMDPLLLHWQVES